MNLMLIKVKVVFIVLLAIWGCKSPKYACELPCVSNDGKELKYAFGAYYNAQGKLTFKLYVSDSIYSADAKRYFDLFKNGAIRL